MQSTAAKRSAWKRFGLIVLCLVGGLLFLEGAVRLRALIKYGSGRTELFRTAVDPVSGLKIPAPGEKTLHIEINSKGFRGPEIAEPKPNGVIRLGFLGESNTFSAESGSNATTWPHRLTDVLQKTWPDVRFDYVNAAFPGYRTTESMRALQFRLKPMNPDVILINQASMDFLTDSGQRAREKGIYAPSVDKESRLDRWSLLWKLGTQNLEILLRQRQARKAAEAKQTLEFRPGDLPAGFHLRLGQLVDEARKTAPVVVLVTFPYKARRNQNPQEQAANCSMTLYHSPWLTCDTVLQGFEEYNQVIREVAREKGILLIDVVDSIPGDGIHFHDSVHYKDPGSELFARQAAEVLKRSGALGNLLESRRAAAAAAVKTESR